MIHINRLMNWLIADHLKDNSYILKKARVLSYIHLFILFIITIFLITTFVVTPENNPPLPAAIVILFGLIYVFKKYGNLSLSGNLIAFFWVVIMFPSVFETGGLYSDNLLWMIIAPLVAFLFATKLSGVVWSISLIVFTVFLYIQEDFVPKGFYRDQTLQFDGSYYFISYLGLFIAVIGMVIIFKNGLEEIIKLLNQNQERLRLHQQEVEEKNKALKATEEKLLTTNKELEQFAYAASHDLKEPLRMIKSYTQLLEKRLNSGLDDRSKEFMHYVQDGTTRMQQLLDDLLEYSRMGRVSSQNQKIIDLNNILFIVMNNLMASMEEKNAAIFATNLPSIFSSSTEMTMLFQNIIANALKFRKPDVSPIIHLKTEEAGNFYKISISDNGIGIAEENLGKVFGIFERLHSKQEYKGSGIGLSTCKKIVNNMGGQINIASTLGKGTTFYFTLPKPNYSIANNETKKGIESVA